MCFILRPFSLIISSPIDPPRKSQRKFRKFGVTNLNQGFQISFLDRYLHSSVLVSRLKSVDMAMILNGHMKEASMNSLLEDPLNSRSSEVGPSPADVAWADSCLNIDEILLSRENGPRPGLNFSEDENLILDDDIIEVSEDEKESLALGKRNGKVRARNQLDHSVFLPNYTEDIGKMELFASDLDLSSTSYEVEEDIFKVWDLSISDDELYVFSESNQVLREVPWIQYNDSSTSRKDLFNVSLDDLIAGLDHLSLTRHLK